MVKEPEIPEFCKECKKRSWMCGIPEFNYDCRAKQMIKEDTPILWEALENWRESFIKRDINDVNDLMSPYPDLYSFTLLLLDIHERLKKLEES